MCHVGPRNNNPMKSCSSNLIIWFWNNWRNFYMYPPFQAKKYTQRLLFCLEKDLVKRKPRTWDPQEDKKTKQKNTVITCKTASKAICK